ncbi:YoaK family protein [Nonomuraea sp. B12E4]|uniref:YoaK family protein n=1 Tax=Nonomuraea sp. B12E4 TaxID=3153564 RepID=UPI00325E251A
MRGGLRRIADALFPGGENPHGELPALLIVLTLVSGLVDAVSFLGLGRVFVANMTGNVAFLGFALAGDNQLAVWAPPLALAAFAGGAWSAGRLTGLLADARREFVILTVAHAFLVAAALALAQLAGHREPVVQAVLIALLAWGMGLQNASVRRAGVPDMTTTVLTRTITGLIVDPPGRAARRRQAVSVLTLLAGALAGAALNLTVGPVPALAVALVLLVLVAVTTPRTPGPPAPAGT